MLRMICGCSFTALALLNASCKQHKAAYTFVSPLVYHTAIQPLLEVIDALSQMRQGLAR